MKELEALIYSQKIRSNGDPVLNWMMGNVVKKKGRNAGPIKTYYPTKERNENKIDGPVALIMAVRQAMLKGVPQRSSYEGLSVEEIVNRLSL
jgi:phage terminase large subunit-like protein